MSENPSETNFIPLQKRVESLLFVATGPVAPNQIAEALDSDAKQVEEALKQSGKSIPLTVRIFDLDGSEQPA